MPLRALDFESSASAIPPLRRARTRLLRLSGVLQSDHASVERVRRPQNSAAFQLARATINYVETCRYLSPPAVAEMLGIEAAKVVRWIRRGELRAINVADVNGKRPRWRISPEALEEFFRSRESRPAPKPIRRRRQSQPADFVEIV